jgi:hypothetical protein
MGDDLGRTQRRRWLNGLAHRRIPAWRRLADRAAAWLLPAHRRRRTLLREALIRL